MKLYDSILAKQDDLLDETTIELFRRYLKEMVTSKGRSVLIPSWADS